MSEKMTCMSFGQLMDWVLTEHKEKNTVFGAVSYTHLTLPTT